MSAGPFTAANDHLAELVETIGLAATVHDAHDRAVDVVGKMRQAIDAGFVEPWIVMDTIDDALTRFDDAERAAIMRDVERAINGSSLEEKPATNGSAQIEHARLIRSSAEFVAGFVPPEYVLDGILQRRFSYSLTGRTSAGKTAIMLLLSAHVPLERLRRSRRRARPRPLFRR